MKQITFASLVFERKKKRARRECFLADIEKVVPWATLRCLRAGLALA